MVEISFANGVMIFLTLFVCTFVGATTGGVGLLTIPACIFFGFSPQVAVATTRVGVLGSSVAGWHCFNKKGHINNKIGIYGSIFAAIGAIIGANIMIDMSPILLKRIISIFMIVSLIVILVKKKKSKSKESKLQPVRPMPLPSKFFRFLGYFSFLIIGFLGGMFGGLGVIISSILVIFFDQTFLEASGTRFIVVFVIAVVAAFVYQAHNSINWPFVAVIVSSMMLGSYFGSIYGIKKGEIWISRLSYIVIALASIKLFIC